MTRVAGAQWLVGPKAEIALRDRDAGSLVGAPGDRATTEAAVAELQGRLAELQSRLWAEGRRSLLVVLQGTDASGKDGTISHVFSGLDLLGTRVASFKEPTVEELAHDFLWRVHARCPAAGEIVIFNRSHYEDVLAARVRNFGKFPENYVQKPSEPDAFALALLADTIHAVIPVPGSEQGQAVYTGS